MVTYKAYNGQIDLNDDELVIRREGAIARLYFTKAQPWHIPHAALGKVRMNKSAGLRDNWVQLVLGATDAPYPTGRVLDDPTVLGFNLKHLETMQEVYDSLLTIIEDNKRRGTELATATFDPGVRRSTQLREKQMARVAARQRPPTEAEKNLVCPHCQTAGKVSAAPVKVKAGISGGKATAAIITGGVSVLGTGLSRKTARTQMFCSNCQTKWIV